MAKEYPVGAKMYLPVWVTAMESDVKVKPDGTEVKTDARFAYTYAYGESRREGYVRYGQPDRLLTAEEVAENVDLIARSTLEEYTEKAERKIRSLEQQLADAKENLSDAQEKVRELTETDCLRVQEFKPIIEERDKLKAEVATRTENVKNLVEENDQLKKLADDLGDENEKLKAELEQEKKRTQVWKDSSEEHRQRAEELEGDVRHYEQDISEVEVTVQKLTKENDSLKADILELKAQIDVFRPDPKEIEALKKRINMLEKLKEVHVRAIRRSTKQLKEKDFMISALVKKGIELEEGGESNG